jgi:hypothetical protein
MAPMPPPACTLWLLATAATWRGEQVALKVFLAEVSPDGKAQVRVCAFTFSTPHRGGAQPRPRVHAERSHLL